MNLRVRRNTVLLAAVVALNSCLFQLAAAVNSLTFVEVTGVSGLLGLGPAIFLAASGVAALPAGRAMDRFGRVPVIAVGFLIAAAGCGLLALATRTDSSVAVIAGMALTGAAGGVALLIRTAAGDMYPPERRARGIAYVLFGAVFGAFLGPTVFSPLFAGKDLDAESLTLPWLAAVALALVAVPVTLLVRPDPKRIAEELGIARADVAPSPAAPLAEILRRRGVGSALLAAVASFAVMVAVMNLTGYVVVEHHDHAQQDVFPIIAAHVVGMYALVLVVGPLIDRIGRGVSLWSGLAMMAVSCAGLAWLESVLAVGALLFGLGLGWSVSFVAATAQLADRAAPAERGKLLGFNDLLAALVGAALALLGGVALDLLGVAALAVGACVLVLLPLVRLVGRPAPAAAPTQ